MLAIQTLDGHLRIWSIAKPPAAKAPEVIRILKRTDSVNQGPNWMAWSKNGRVLQYAEGYVFTVCANAMPKYTSNHVVHQ